MMAWTSTRNSFAARWPVSQPSRLEGARQPCRTCLILIALALLPSRRPMASKDNRPRLACTNSSSHGAQRGGRDPFGFAWPMAIMPNSLTTTSTERPVVVSASAMPMSMSWASLLLSGTGGLDLDHIGDHINARTSVADLLGGDITQLARRTRGIGRQFDCLPGRHTTAEIQLDLADQVPFGRAAMYREGQ